MSNLPYPVASPVLPDPREDGGTHAYAPYPQQASFYPTGSDGVPYPVQGQFLPPGPAEPLPYPNYTPCSTAQPPGPYPPLSADFPHQPYPPYPSYPSYPTGHPEPSWPGERLPAAQPHQGYPQYISAPTGAAEEGLKMAEEALKDTAAGNFYDRMKDHAGAGVIGGSHGADIGQQSAGRPGTGHFKSSKGTVNFCNQDHHELKRKCQSKGVLFEDPEFPASNKLLVDDNSKFIISYFGRSAFDESSIEWLRPHEICQRLNYGRPQMFVGQSDRFDINQGEIGDCWFLAAVANLVENKTLFHRVVPQDQSFSQGYAGIFKFRFWRFGEWVEVVVDDRLPTRKGRLIYLRSVEKNEFWGALLEKAYAKLHGSYKNLEGGLTIEAAVDFTGGIPELISLGESKLSPERVFYIMSKADACGAFLGAALARSGSAYQAQKLGLQSRHAYTITKVVEVRSPKVRGGIPLVRLRNPHGNSNEWRGDWSDDDRNWRLIPQQLRHQLGLTFEDDGEFYMSFRDFFTFFGELEICHLTPDAIDEKDGRKKFEVFNFHGQWIAGSSAGGCGNSGNGAFSSNPQFFINLNDPDPYDEETLCPVVISVAQKCRKRKTEHAIGFKVFRCNLEDRHLDASFFNRNSSIDRVDTFINLREVSKRITLTEGRYCIIPCTFNTGEQGEFLMRVFVERSWGISESGRGRSVDHEGDKFFQSMGDVTDGVGNVRIDKSPLPGGLQAMFGSKKQQKMAGFALRQLEKSFPKGIKRLKEFYNWATDRDSEFALLSKIIKSI